MTFYTFFCAFTYGLVFLFGIFDFCQIDNLTEVFGDTADGEEQRDTCRSQSHRLKSTCIRSHT